MTYLLETSFAQTGGTGNTELRQIASVTGQSGDVWALRTGSVDFAFIAA
jgi:hypothetical protein